MKYIACQLWVKIRVLFNLNIDNSVFIAYFKVVLAFLTLVFIQCTLLLDFVIWDFQKRFQNFARPPSNKLLYDKGATYIFRTSRTTIVSDCWKNASNITIARAKPVGPEFSNFSIWLLKRKQLVLKLYITVKYIKYILIKCLYCNYICGNHIYSKYIYTY